MSQNPPLATGAFCAYPASRYYGVPQPLRSIFSRRVWQHVLVLVVGAILAPGQRMVTSILRVTGLSQVSSFQRYHRVLNRDAWSSLRLSHILLRLLVAAFVPEGPLAGRGDLP